MAYSRGVGDMATAYKHGQEETKKPLGRTTMGKGTKRKRDTMELPQRETQGLDSDLEANSEDEGEELSQVECPLCDNDIEDCVCTCDECDRARPACTC